MEVRWCNQVLQEMMKHGGGCIMKDESLHPEVCRIGLILSMSFELGFNVTYPGWQVNLISSRQQSVKGIKRNLSYCWLPCKGRIKSPKTSTYPTVVEGCFLWHWVFWQFHCRWVAGLSTWSEYRATRRDASWAALFMMMIMAILANGKWMNSTFEVFNLNNSGCVQPVKPFFLASSGSLRFCWYTPLNEHSNGKWTLWRCVSYWKWGYSIAILVYQRVDNHDIPYPIPIWLNNAFVASMPRNSYHPISSRLVGETWEPGVVTWWVGDGTGAPPVN